MCGRLHEGAMNAERLIDFFPRVNRGDGPKGSFTLDTPTVKRVPAKDPLAGDEQRIAVCGLPGQRCDQQSRGSKDEIWIAGGAGCTRLQSRGPTHG